MIKYLFIALSLIASPSLAQQSFSFNGESETVSGEAKTGQGAAITYDWQADIEIGTLLGEPVISSHFKYDIKTGQVTLPSSTNSRDPYETHNITGLPGAAISKIKLYDLTIRVNFESVNGDFYLETDAGSPSGSGTWSFNVPGSPDWGKMFQYDRSIEGNRHYLSAEQAKSEYKRGLSPKGAYLTEQHLTLFDLHGWYNIANPRKTVEAYSAAINHLSEGIQISYGLPSFTQNSEELLIIHGRTVKEQIELADEQKEQFNKLKNLPDRFKTGSNEVPYETALLQAQEIVNTTFRSEYRENRKTDQVDAMTSRRQGKKPQFDNTPIDGEEKPKEQTSDPKTTQAPPSQPGGKPDIYVYKGNPKQAYLRLEYVCKKPYNNNTDDVLYISFVEKGFSQHYAQTRILGNDVRYLPGQSHPFKHLTLEPDYVEEVKPILRSFHSKVQGMDSTCTLHQYGVKATMIKGYSTGTLDYCQEYIEPGDDSTQEICVEMDIKPEFYRER